MEAPDCLALATRGGWTCTCEASKRLANFPYTTQDAEKDSFETEDT